jgi:hypothetical protein
MSTLISGFLILAMLFGGAGATAYAAGESLPDETLYPVKTALEDARLALTSDPGAEIELLLELSNERAEEIRALVSAGREVPRGVALRLQEHLRLMLEAAARMGDPAMEQALEQTRLRIQAQLRVLQQSCEGADCPSGEALSLAEQTLTQTRAIIEGALEDPTTFRLRQGTDRPEEAPTQPENTPGDEGPGPSCDNCTPQGPQATPQRNGNGEGGPR